MVPPRSPLMRSHEQDRHRPEGPPSPAVTVPNLDRRFPILSKGNSEVQQVRSPGRGRVFDFYDVGLQPVIVGDEDPHVARLPFHRKVGHPGRILKAGGSHEPFAK